MSGTLEFQVQGPGVLWGTQELLFLCRRGWVTGVTERVLEPKARSRTPRHSGEGWVSSRWMGVGEWHLASTLSQLWPLGAGVNFPSAEFEKMVPNFETCLGLGLDRGMRGNSG